MGNAVRVKTYDLWKEERETLESILRKYQYGSFDSMQDMYVMDRAKSTVERQAKFVTLTNEFTYETRMKMKEVLRDQWGIIDDQSSHDKRGIWYETAVFRDLNQLNGSPLC